MPFILVPILIHLNICVLSQWNLCKELTFLKYKRAGYNWQLHVILRSASGVWSDELKII